MSRQLEHQHSIALMQWWGLEANKRKIDQRLLMHIPNGGRRSIGVARKLKEDGVRAGVPDYLCAIARGSYHGLWIELKAPDGRLSDNQREMIELLRIHGYHASVAFGWEDASKTISWYLGL